MEGKLIHLVYLDQRSREEPKDEGNPVSQLLDENQWYEMLLIAQIGLGKRKVVYFPNIPSGTALQLQTTKVQIGPEMRERTDVVQGIILDLAWNVRSIPWLAVAGSRVYAHRFVLIETAIGKMVLDYQALQERLGEQISQVVPGGYLEWEPARLDILAILAKRDPRPGE